MYHGLYLYSLELTQSELCAAVLEQYRC